AKLLAAAGLWFGWPAVAPFLIYPAIAGGVLALAFQVWSMLKIEQEVREIGWAKRLLNFKADLPYGIAIAAGAILAFPGTWWMPVSP
ncbi:MAG: peptidase, partial [Parvibaculaceae bacterium]